VDTVLASLPVGEKTLGTWDCEDVRDETPLNPWGTGLWSYTKVVSMDREPFRSSILTGAMSDSDAELVVECV